MEGYDLKQNHLSWTVLVMKIVTSEFFVLFFIISWGSIITISNTRSQPFVFDLIFRDSPSSPFFNPNMSEYDRVKSRLQRSLARHAYLNAKRMNISTKTRIDGEVRADHSGDAFLARMWMGTPPMENLVILDTASSLLWIQCKPCHRCYDQSLPIYDREKSSTFAQIPCQSHYCQSMEHMKVGHCNNHTVFCVYRPPYEDNSYSKGMVAKDFLTLRFRTRNQVHIPNVVFGCGVMNNNTYPVEDTGILGLGPASYSLASQLSNQNLKRFSYCLGNITNPSTSGNLIIANSAIMNGSRIQMITGSGGLEHDLHYILLEDISIGSRRLGIPRGTFTLKPNGTGGVGIDTGSYYTYLAPVAYSTAKNALKNELKRIGVKRIKPDPHKDGRLCAQGSVARDVNGFRPLSFNFANGAKLVLDKWSVFSQEDPTLFCATFVSAEDGEVSLIGSTAQQFYNVGYDLKMMVISFK